MGADHAAKFAQRGEYHDAFGNNLQTFQTENMDLIIYY